MASVARAAPVYTTDTDLWFTDGSITALQVRSNALLPTDRVRFPRSFWNIQGGGGYVGQLSSGWSWGATLNLGTATSPGSTLQIGNRAQDQEYSFDGWFN